MTNNAFDLTGQTVFVTGAAGSIGAAAARACATLGARLVITDIRRPDMLESELREAGTSVSAHVLDNTSRADVDALFAEIGPIDALADCSGIYVKGDWVDGGDEWEDLFHRTMDVNVRGPMNLVRACLPGMMKQKSGRIALVGSMAAHNAGSTLAVEPSYAASKGALHTLVRYFARQAAASGVVVNAIAPGPIQTPLLVSSKQAFNYDVIPLGRLGQPEEIGWPVAFLCSRGTGFLTGAILDVNGGVVFS